MVTTIVTVTGKATKLRIISVYVTCVPSDAKPDESSSGLYQKAQIALSNNNNETPEPIAWITMYLRAKFIVGETKRHRPVVVLGYL